MARDLKEKPTKSAQNRNVPGISGSSKGHVSRPASGFEPTKTRDSSSRTGSSRSSHPEEPVDYMENLKAILDQEGIAKGDPADSTQKEHPTKDEPQGPESAPPDPSPVDTFYSDKFKARDKEGSDESNTEDQPSGPTRTSGKFVPAIGSRSSNEYSQNNSSRHDDHSPDTETQRSSLGSLVGAGRKSGGKKKSMGKGKKKAKTIIIGLIMTSSFAGVAAIIGLVPQAIDSILTRATTSQSNFASESIIKRQVNQYIKEEVLPQKCRGATSSLPQDKKDRCNVGVSKKDSLRARAKQDFKAADIETKMKDKGIDWKYDPNTETYSFIRTKDGSASPDFSKAIDYDNLDIFELGKEEASQFLDSVTRDIVNNESGWKRFFIRGPTVRAMRVRTGSTGCFWLCAAKDSFNNVKKYPKKAFGRFIKTHVLSPQSELLGSIADCLISGGASCTSRHTSDFARNKVSEAAANLFDEEFAEKILKSFDAVKEKGASRYVLEQAVKKLVEWLGGEISEKALGNVVGVILLLKTIAEKINVLVELLPKALRIKNMMAVALVASTFLVAINEARRGALPLGDYTQMISVFMGMGGSRIFADMFMSSFRTKGSPSSQPYNCSGFEDGDRGASVAEELISSSKMEDGDLTCNSFKLDFTPNISNNSFLKTVSSTWDTIKGTIGLEQLIAVADGFSSLAGTLTDKLSGLLPFYDELQKKIAEKSQGLIDVILGAISPTIVSDDFAGLAHGLSNLPGARVFDSLAGGSSTINQYITPRDELGGAPLSLTSQTELDSAIAQQQTQDTQYASFYDRFFNLDPTEGVADSLLTQFAGTAFGNYGVANIINPLQNISLAFNSAGGGTALASSGSIASVVSGGFGVPVRGHTVGEANAAQKGSLDDVDPESEQCKKEISDWKSQIEDRTDGGSAADPDKQDVLGFGIPDGDGSGKSNCLLVDTSLKVLTTKNSDEDDFPIEGIKGAGTAVTAEDYNTTDVPCAAGTTDVGDAKAYKDEKPYDIKLCSIPGFVSTGTEDVDSGINLVRVNSTISEDTLKMFNDMVASGMNTPTAVSSFRSMEFQTSQYGDGSSGEVAKPGTSNHQMGYAIDFALGGCNPGGKDRVGASRDNCQTNSPQTSPPCKDTNGTEVAPMKNTGTVQYDYLTANASNYKFNQLCFEAWHWEHEPAPVKRTTGGGASGGGSGECAAGMTKVEDTQTYVKGVPTDSTICSYDKFPSTGSEDGGVARFSADVSAKVKEMVDAAAAGGVQLQASSTFRSNAKQEQIYNCFANNVCEPGESYPDAAEPGFSNHQSGSALDFSNGSPSWNWMKSNADGYGFKWFGGGDPIHWSTTGG